MKLVTGGRGFIGSVLVRALGDEARLCDDDLGDEFSQIHTSLIGVDTVFHLAAKVGASQHDPVAYCRDNVMGTAALLEALPPTVEHVVLASSCVVPYGGSPYAVTKAAQEDLCAAWCASHGVTLSILRLHAVYGPGQGDHGTYEGVVAKFAHALLRGAPPVVDDDGGQLRDFVHVDDVTTAMLAAAKQRFDGIAEVGTGVGCTLIGLARGLQERLGGPPPIVTGVPRRATKRNIVADLDSEFRWGSTINLFDGLNRYAESLKAPVPA